MPGYVMIPVKPRTKKLVDEYKERCGAKTYDEAIAEAVKPKDAFEILGPLIGKYPRTGPFVREKNDRDLSRFEHNGKDY